MPSDDDITTPTKMTPANYVSLGVYILGVILAIYLSWTCNTTAKIKTLWRVWYAFWAGLFNWAYCLWYAILRRGTCGCKPKYVK